MSTMQDLIRRRAREMGYDPIHSLTVAQLESNFNPRAVSPSGRHRGLYQFGGPEWSTYGTNPDPFNPEANLDAFWGYQTHAKELLSKGLGREPTPQDLYLAHQQGPTGALKLLSNPDARAVDIVGRSAVEANGGNVDMTAGQFADLWRNKYDAGRKGFTGNDSPTGGLPPLPSQTVGTAPEWQESTTGGLLGPSIPYGGGDYYGDDSPATPEATAKGVKMAQSLLDRDSYRAQRGFDDLAATGRGLLSMGAAPPPMAPPEIRYPTMQSIAPAPSYRPPQGQGLLADPLRRRRGILGA